MSKENNENNNNNDIPVKKRKKKKKKKRVVLRVILVVVLLSIIIGGGALAGMVIGIIKSAPDIDPTNVLGTLSESSVIVDRNGTVIEQIHDPNENRDIVELKDIPKNLQNAFLAIEDHRFNDHFGIDITRIVGSMISNIKEGDLTAQGASTITQQLVKNLYLTNEKVWERKIKEMYLAIMMERKLSKDQILENYLNTIPLGQSAYGVQTASQTYFSKDASDLTLAESALLAGAAKSTVKYAPYNRYNMSNVDDVPEEDIIGYVYIGSVQYACVYNQKAIDRQRVVLKRMLELELISQKEYDNALAEDMHIALNPGQTKMEGINATTFTDYVKEKVAEDLMKTQGLTYEAAQNYIYRGGLSIYTTMDVSIQKSLENSYDNFGELLLGAAPSGTKPMAQDWRAFRWSGNEGTGALDANYNVLNETGQIIYYDKLNIIDDEDNLFLDPSEYSFDANKDLVINSKKFNIYSSAIDIVDCYTIDEKLNFVSHSIGGLNIGNNYEIIEQTGAKGSFKINDSYIKKNPEMFIVSSDGFLRIPKDYFYYEEKGIVQPQSASVIMDYRTGEIKAMIGGRNIEGSKTFNRAIDAYRQPGSTIKPLSVYLPALDLGYSAAFVLDDVPRYNKGERWPKNWYEHKDVKYWGLQTMRKSVEQSINVNAVSMLEMISTEKSIEYLAKLGLIDLENPENDTFVTPEENPIYNDVTLASLALGGLTKGFSPLSMTAAYAAIANDGMYIEPTCYTKVVNKEGTVVMQKVPETRMVVSPEVATVMKDILRSTVNPGLSYWAKLPARLEIEVAGKTGTTQVNGDFWYMGFSPYYVGGVWVGNDNVQMKLSGDSGSTARLWSGIMTPIHEGLAPSKIQFATDLPRANVCSQSGKIPTSLCSQDSRGSQVISEYFVPGTQPTETCSIHVRASICTASNLLKSPFCPGDLIADKSFIARDPLYDPNANPYTRGGSFEAKYQANILYQQVLQDAITSTKEELKQIYAGLVTFDATDKITAVNGIAVEDLNYAKFITLDYQFQVPTLMCTYHTKWHYDQWLLNGNDNPDDGEDTTDVEKPDEDKDNQDGDVTVIPPENNDNDNDNDSNSGNTTGNGVGIIESGDDTKPTDEEEIDTPSILDSITN